jgi:peptidoglycan/xylan/chitin deacetylase (PgdA/CDA1 family)
MDASEPRQTVTDGASSSQPAVSAAPGQDSYQAMYPDLYAPVVKSVHPSSGKTVYLTFDDGPSELTMPLLDVLDHYHIKATFFLMGYTDPANIKALKEIANRGHVIGVHTYTHRYREIYASPAAYLYDFNRMHDLIKRVTGIDTQIYRYAGGSVNAFNQNTARAITQEMNRRGYVYFDWNVSADDAEPGATAASIYNNTINGVHSRRQSVILLHNSSSKRDTLAQMPKIIETLQREGYQFKTLEPSLDNRPYLFPLPKPVTQENNTGSNSVATGK